MRVNGDDRGADSPSSARPLSSSAQPSPMRNLSSASGGLYVSAPGKIILFGEHAVVYGRTAIAGSIDLRTYVSLFTSADGRIYLSLPDLGVEKTWMLKDLIKAGERLAAECPVDESQAPSLELLVPVARKLSGSCEDQCGVQHLAILAFWYVLLGVAHRKSFRKLNSQDGDGSHDASMDLLAVKTTVRFELPSCVGLGSSGAFCVCIVTSLLQSSGLIPPPTIVADAEGNLTWEEEHLDMIRKWSAAAESLIHGRASGLDAAVCTYGGLRRYGWQSITHLAHVGCNGGVASFKPGTRIEHLRNLPDLRVILVNSKVERNTSRMVQTVKERMKRFPEVVDGVFHSIDAISREAAGILGKAAGSDHEGENGEGGTGDGTSAPPTPLLNGGTQGGIELDHRSLQPHSGSVRSASLSSYISAGKRDSCASALSGCSTAAGGTSGRSGELVDTFAKLNELCRMNNQLLIALGVGHPKVDQICTLLARYGIHPKMTGAGGGGSVFAFLKPDTPATLLDMITNELVRLGYDVWQPPLGGPGVVEHQRRPALFSTPVAAAPGAAAAAGSSSCGGSSGTSALSTPSLHHK
ncbi:hypothetical protein PENTCL1PPCAC_13126 [Pristionchus entomophagus]|uniref:GHMP kinase C-terminal domain-containing protein n=1 Tax=Pristionchus entomophagus TaxID=358040 RepID=A0AAV5TFH0_9BILA|nr:hypothetical protein PENTCL1PPCAC_13126 [Pristionchus entomophagus]